MEVLLSLLTSNDDLETLKLHIPLDYLSTSLSLSLVESMYPVCV